jgi:glycosyltransferase involved in cell wall biosynthesis
MYVIPQGINEHYLSLQCDRDSNTILSVGSISRRKGHLLLLQAFDQVCKQVPNAQLVIAGVLAEQDYYNEMQAYIHQSPYKSQISLQVNLSQKQLYELYQKAHIFALHSQEESQGIVLVVAMATRLPVVSTNVGGIPYVVEMGKTGLLANYGNIDDFSAHIIKLLNSHDCYDKMSTFAVHEAQRYIWRNIADEVDRLYNEIQ